MLQLRRTGDHKSWECSKKCTICETNFCGAPKGEPDKCPCDKKEMPPNDQVKNYIGKPIPEKLYSQLDVATHTSGCRRRWGGRP